MELLLVIALIAASVYFRTAIIVWVPFFAALLLLVSWHGVISIPILIISWLLYFTVLAFVTLKPLRLQLFTSPVLQYVQRILPPMSETERIALDAGNVWWEGDLFCGKPKWAKLHAMPKPQLTEEEQAFLENEVETLCGLVDDWETVHHQADLSPEVWQYIKEHQFFGMVIPKEYGGKGFSALAHSAIITKLGSRGASVAVTVMVPNSLGPAELLLAYGTQAQKDHYLPRLASGQDIPCFGLTGLEAGSDAGAISDTGIVCKQKYEGKEVIGLRLNFAKRYITLAPVATVIGLAFKLYDPDHLLSEEEDRGITLCLVPRETAGVESSQRHYPLNMAFMNGPVTGKDVFIPLDFIIGGPDKIGEGWRMLMECLSIGRSISLPALGTAVSQLSTRMTAAYANLRKQFKLPIGKFEGIEEALALIAGQTYTIEAARLFTANAVDMKVRPSLASAIAKYHMTEMARENVNAAMDVHGGRGIQMGPSNYLANHYVSLPIMITVEGANILTRNLIIFGQGAMRCHPYVRAEMMAAANSDPKAGLREFDKLLLSHIGFTCSNLVRSFVYGITGGHLICAPKEKSFKKYYQQLTRMSCALALSADVAMLFLGGQLKRKERLSARFADVLSQLYLGSAVLKYFHDKDHPEDEKIYAQWALQNCLAKTQIAFDGIFRNFPLKFIGRLMRFIVFPFGRSYLSVDDSHSQELARALLSDHDTRDRLTQLCYVGNAKEDKTASVDAAMSQLIATKEIDTKIQAAIAAGQLKRNADHSALVTAAMKEKIITEKELKQLIEAEAARLAAIEVDEFPFDYFGG